MLARSLMAGSYMWVDRVARSVMTGSYMQVDRVGS